MHIPCTWQALGRTPRGCAAWRRPKAVGRARGVPVMTPRLRLQPRFPAGYLAGTDPHKRWAKKRGPVSRAPTATSPKTAVDGGA
jgi:hypothetical protein